MSRKFGAIGIAMVLVIAVVVIPAGRAASPENIAGTDDETVKSKIEERLRMDDRLDWEVLEVEVDRGQATLYGEVRTPEEKGLAALIVTTVPGVKGLTNSIIVEPALSPDHKLTNAIWNAFRTTPALQSNDTLKVSVKDAVAKLHGTVKEPLEKKAAEKAAASVPGVAKVVNLIEVKQGSPEDLTQKGNVKMREEGVQVIP
jgi:osmotically-inducible protein OsmY